MATLPRSEDDEPAPRPRPVVRPVVALVGNPNTGKTTLFNRLTGLRAKTANFPGTTLERRVGTLVLGGRRVEIEDLPGLYGLGARSAEERVANDALLGNAGRPRPAAVLVVVDQTSLARNLYLVSQVRETGLPLLVALNMSDIAAAEGLRVDPETLSREIGAPVVATERAQRRGHRSAACRARAAGERPRRRPAAARACRSLCRLHGLQPRLGALRLGRGRRGTGGQGAPQVSARRTAAVDRVAHPPRRRALRLRARDGRAVRRALQPGRAADERDRVGRRLARRDGGRPPARGRGPKLPGGRRDRRRRRRARVPAPDLPSSSSCSRCSRTAAISPAPRS